MSQSLLDQPGSAGARARADYLVGRADEIRAENLANNRLPAGTLYGRKASLIVASAKDGKALDVSDLHFQFSIRQWDRDTPNTADFRVFNVTKQTAARIGTEFDRVILQAGYAAQFGTIFDGTIVHGRRGRSSPADTYCAFTAYDADRAHNQAVVNTTLAAGATPNDVHRALTDAMAPLGATTGYTAPLAGPALPRGRVLYGMARDHLRTLADATGTVWNIQDGRVQFLPRNGYGPDEAVVLNAATGLVGLPQQTIEGIMVRCLLNPLLRVGNKLQINNGSIQAARIDPDPKVSSIQKEMLPKIADGDGVYRILAIDHTGDTRGNDWYSEVACVQLDAGAPVAQVNRQRS